jgi:hypothetical protein
MKAVIWAVMSAVIEADALPARLGMLVLVLTLYDGGLDLIGAL